MSPTLPALWSCPRHRESSGSLDRNRPRNGSFGTDLLRWIGISVLLAGLTPSLVAQPPESPAEERVTVYPTYGYWTGDRWILPLRLWVHEPSDGLRRLASKVAREELRQRAGLQSLSEAQKARFRDRIEGFIADSESGERVQLAFESDPLDAVLELQVDEGLAETDRNGLVRGWVELTEERAEELLEAQGSRDGWLAMRVVSSDHEGSGRVRLVPSKGLSVISDIDDTVKITEIPKGEATVLHHTFFGPFRPTPCMVEIYRQFPESVSFHFISGGPWQLYEPLLQFLESAGFPSGSFHMKNVRTNLSEPESYGDLWRLLVQGSGEVTQAQKIRQITRLMQRFPERQFLLIGDSGERDPEIYRRIREEFGARVVGIVIRQASEGLLSNPIRFEGMTMIANDPEECPSIPAHLPGLTKGSGPE